MKGPGLSGAHQQRLPKGESGSETEVEAHGCQSERNGIYRDLPWGELP